MYRMTPARALGAAWYRAGRTCTFTRVVRQPEWLRKAAKMLSRIRVNPLLSERQRNHDTEWIIRYVVEKARAEKEPNRFVEEMLRMIRENGLLHEDVLKALANEPEMEEIVYGPDWAL